MAAITADGRQELVALYLTMFGDAPSTVKLAEMVQAREAGKTLFEVAATQSVDPAFALVASKDAESFATYLANSLLVSDTPASARAWALNWVITQVQGTKTKAQVIAEAVQAIRATTNPNYTTAKAELAADITVALNNIDNPTTPANTFTLTTGADQALIIGKSGSDAYNAVIGGDGTVANGTTFNAGDNLDGAGGVDTLNLSISGTNAGPHTAASFVLKNVEKVLVSNFETSANLSTIDMAGATGVTTVGFSGASDTGATTFSNVTNLVDVQLANSNAALTVTYLGSVVAGTADTQKVSVENVGQGTVNNSTLTINGVETFDVTANSKSTLLALTGNVDTTVKLGGAGALTITNALDSTVKTVDASASTGGVTFTLNNAAQNVSVTGGKGNDVIATGTDLTVNDTLAGGDGIDTLVVAEAADLVDGLKITGFEAVRATESGGTLDLSKLTGITAVDYRVASAATSTTVSNSTATTVTISADAATITHGVKDATLLTATNDSLTVVLQTASLTPNDVDVTSLVVNGIENLTITSNGATTSGADSQNSVTITQTAGSTTTTLTNVTVTGASDISLGTVGASNDKLTTITGSALTGALTLTNASTATARTTITGGAGNDNITGRATGDSIVTGAGNDTVSSGNGSDSVDGGAGNDNLTSGTGNDTLAGGDGDDTINSGSGNDSITGGAGNDALTFTLTQTAGVASMGLTSADTLDGGDGVDTITFSGSLAVASTLDLASTTDTTFTGVKNVETMVLAPSTSALTVKIGDIALGAFNNIATFTTTGATAAVNLDASAVLNSAAAITFTGTTGVAATYTVGNNKDLVTFSNQGDTLTVITPQFVQATDSLVGGEGADTFKIANTATTDVTVTSAQLAGLSGFETWTVDSETAAAATAVSITVTDAVVVANADATSGALTVSRATGDTGVFTFNASAVTSRNVNLTGGDGNDVLTGGSGNDSLTGGAGVDVLTGGAGNDTFTATTISFGETYAGGDGTLDVLTVSTTGQSLTGVVLTGTEQIRLAQGITINGRADAIGTVAIGQSATTNTGTVTLALDLSGATSVNLSGVTAGQAGATGSAIAATYTNLGATATNLTLTGLNDTLVLGNVANIVSSGAGNDNITGGTSTDTLLGGAGNDTLVGGTGVDSVSGDAGDDNIALVAAEADTLEGGTGTDTLVLGAGANANVNLTTTADQSSDTAVVTGFENVDASSLGAGVNATAISTGSVITTSSTAAHVDTVVGGVGNDTVSVGLTAALFATQAIVDTLQGGDGTDTVAVGTSGTAFAIANNDLWSARITGFETIKANANTAAVTIALDVTAYTEGVRTVDLSAVTVATGSSIDISEYVAADSGSTLTGSSTGATSIIGGTGNDTIAGGSVVDTLVGGAGNDSITAGAGADVIVSGAGTDTIVLTETVAAADAIWIGRSDTGGTDLAVGSQGLETVTGFGTTDVVSIDIGGVVLTNSTLKIATLTADGATLTSVANTATAADVDVVLVLGTHASYAAVQVILNATAGAITDATNGAVVAWTNSSGNTMLTYDTNISAGAGTGTDLVQLTGVATTALGAANFVGAA